MRVTYGLLLLRLSRLPFHGGPKGKPSGIPSAAVVPNRGASVSSGFPPSDAGRGPCRSGACSLQTARHPEWGSRVGGGADGARPAAPAHVAPGRTPPLVGQLVGQRESEEGLPKGWAGSGIPCQIFQIVP